MNRRTIEGTILKKMNPKVISSILDLKQQKSSEFVIASGSMHPSLKIGEKVTFRDIKPSDERKFRVGDVVVFEDSGRRIAHRLVRVKGDIIVTKGDNLPDCDQPIPFSDIIGFVEGKSSKKALFYFFIRNKIRKVKLIRTLVKAVKKWRKKSHF